MTNDKQRERLVELLENHCAVAECKAHSQDCTAADCASCLADHILADGVIVLPNLRYKQMVYHIYNNKIMPLEVTSYAVRPEFGNMLQIHLYRNGFNGCCTPDEFGKTVFLTKEEAEEVLKGGVQG